MKRIFSTTLILMASWFVAACNQEPVETDTGSDTTIEIIEVDAQIDGVLGNVTVRQLEHARTLLVVAWTQESDSDEVWLEFTFENGEWYQSPAVPRSSGDHEEVLLGVPEGYDVTAKFVARTGKNQQESAEFEVTNGMAPSNMPRLEVTEYNATIASPHKWLYGSVDQSYSPDNYGGPFWLYIIDRQGRVVWYYSDLGDNPVLGFPRISRDGRYIFFGNRTPWSDNVGFVNTLVKMTLDRTYFDEFEMPLWDNVDQTDEGTFLYNTRNCYLMEHLTDGTTRTVWDTREVTGEDCYSNTVNWNPLDDTVLMSFPYLNTVSEVDRQTGNLVATYGDNPGSYSFDPSSWGFDFQHYPHITEFGTLLVSTHQPGSSTVHFFVEFDVDRANSLLTEIWSFNDGSEFADAMGEVHYVENGGGNVLGNYGTDGVIKEITRDNQVAWQVTSDSRMVGHCILVEDLYAINRGPDDNSTRGLSLLPPSQTVVSFSP